MILDFMRFIKDLQHLCRFSDRSIELFEDLSDIEELFKYFEDIDLDQDDHSCRNRTCASRLDRQIDRAYLEHKDQYGARKKHPF